MGSAAGGIQVKAGNAYYITAGSTPQGAAKFILTCEPQSYTLSNDECAGAIGITDGTYTYDSTKASNPQTPGFQSP